MNLTQIGAHGFVRLDAHMADDYSVINSARVSFARQDNEPGGSMTEKDEGLIRFLMRERHGTPFEHNAFRFHIKCPIFVAREWFRHRIGSFNEFSARYSTVPDEFYIPELDVMRKQAGKPGAYMFEPVSDEVARDARQIINAQAIIAHAAYRELLEIGIAKELARVVLPVSMMTQFYWTVNARALMNFLSLRTDTNAQLEIRQFAQAVEDVFASVMPVTHKAWTESGKITP